jgi:hypothetical protein
MICLVRTGSTFAQDGAFDETSKACCLGAGLGYQEDVHPIDIVAEGDPRVAWAGRPVI